MTEPSRCQVCGTPLVAGARGRPPRYCSQACRARAYRTRRSQGTTAPEPGRARLTRAAVLAAAVTLADAEGVEALSMRRLAAALEVGTMSLYGQFRDREELVERMVDLVYGQHRLPSTAPTDWRAALELSARLEWRIHLAHPWVAPVAASFTRPPISPELMAHGEWRMRALDGHGLGLDTLVQISATISNFTLSTALGHAREVAAERGGQADRRAWFAARRADIDAVVGGGDLPLLARLDESGFRASQPQAMFDFGLELLLDGVAALLADRAA